MTVEGVGADCGADRIVAAADQFAVVDPKHEYTTQRVGQHLREEATLHERCLASECRSGWTEASSENCAV